MRTLGVLLLGLCPIGLAAQDDKKDAPFEGTWDVVKLEQACMDFTPALKEQAMTMAFEGNKYTFTVGGAVAEKGTFKLDPKAKTPTVDYDITEGRSKGKKQLGIYHLDGDMLKICLNDEGAETRPTKFTTGKDVPEFVLFTLKKKAKK